MEDILVSNLEPTKAHSLFPISKPNHKGGHLRKSLCFNTAARWQLPTFKERCSQKLEIWWAEGQILTDGDEVGGNDTLLTKVLRSILHTIENPIQVIVGWHWRQRSRDSTHRPKDLHQHNLKGLHCLGQLMKDWKNSRANFKLIS